MEKQNKLPDVIFMSGSEMSERPITEAGICLKFDDNGINFKEASLSDVIFDDTAEHRNITQLWLPAKEKPDCDGSLLCWCKENHFFVHEHYCHDDFSWEKFIDKYHVARYCYIANLIPNIFL